MLGGLLDNVVSRVVMGWARAGATALGALLVRDGLMDQNGQAQLVGALMTIIPLIFSAYDKYKTHQKQVDAELQNQAAAVKVSQVTPLTVEQAKTAIANEAAELKHSK